MTPLTFATFTLTLLQLTFFCPFSRGQAPSASQLFDSQHPPQPQAVSIGHGTSLEELSKSSSFGEDSILPVINPQYQQDGAWDSFVHSDNIKFGASPALASMTPAVGGTEMKFSPTDAVDEPNKRKWSSFSSWGKRDQQDEAEMEKRWKQMAVWGKRDDGKDKKWREMSVWGKRDDNIDKKWREMSVWGKRDDNMDKKWREMSVWGKRDDNMDKKWREMSVWGKRDDNMDKKWREMSVWGKRDDNMDKKWREMSVWGKRDDNMDKKWREMSVWGKRDDNKDKKWREMSVWGKRDDNKDKKWREMSVWGKRDDEMEKKWKQMAVWGKRIPDLEKKWKNVAVWGKRDQAVVAPASPELDKKWREMSVWGKRSGEQFQNEMVNDASTFDKRSLRHIVPNWQNYQKSRKRPSWSYTGFTAWGKRSGDGVDWKLLKDYLLKNLSGGAELNPSRAVDSSGSIVEPAVPHLQM